MDDEPDEADDEPGPLNTAIARWRQREDTGEPSPHWSGPKTHSDSGRRVNRKPADQNGADDERDD